MKNKKVKMIPIPGHPGLYTFANIERDPVGEKKVVDEIMRQAEEMGRKRKEREAYWFGHK